MQPVFIYKADVESHDKARMTRWQVPDDEEGPYLRRRAFHGKILLSEESGNGSDLNLGHMNFLRH